MSRRRVIKGASVLPLDGRRTLRQADILIEDGVIAAIGGVSAEGAEVETVRGVVLPGLVQAHVHLLQSLLDRGFVPNADPYVFQEVQLPEWLAVMDKPAAEIMARAAFVQGLAAGTSSFVDPTGGDYASTFIKAATDLKVRLVIGFDVETTDPEQALIVLQEELAAHAKDGRISGAIWAQDAERIPTRMLTRAYEASNKHGVPLIVHLGLVPTEINGLARLERAGVLGPNLVLTHAHGRSLMRRGVIDKLADSQTTVVVTPGLSILMGAPPAPLAALLQAGVPVALGSDTGATRLGLDPLKEARLAYRQIEGQVDAPAIRALELAGAGRAFGLPGGGLEVGRSADLVVVELEPDPHDDAETVATRLLDSAGPEHIREVYVAGRPLIREGVLKLRPSDDVVHRIQKRLARVREREVRHTKGLAYRMLATMVARRRMASGWHV